MVAVTIIPERLVPSYSLSPPFLLTISNPQTLLWAPFQSWEWGSAKAPQCPQWSLPLNPSGQLYCHYPILTALLPLVG